ncbi:bacillithiol biosynthesis cysteine-adding enzyme BshC [Ureibacillus sp. FSL K6-8385]|mgnify:CR=1 FL=1|uniref:Putative cysteine ligase BshC n=2 Tax=Bacillati TaxID=1783272 RepID=A0A540V484_9BACL|nr:bacillithiol biosynthesis cysteine-adding enzyme BshC [Ureibacillus terrenus]MED3660307.1 bacillithiol biosynthesis cysteine-adding enzyme BshC [Ureibacillus terrenus]MED3762463.1 bacillithiol biosynthesis cysteine-adding enzyme BshC [Ureibacillus terrenus]TQE91534.1 bacillithiol biosynthesis cysteine-adding enzyme BshC [Ureibacillus terrenus]
MELERIAPVDNKLLADYWKESENLLSFYQYPYNDESFRARARYLNKNHFDRKRLCTVIEQFMEPLGISEKAKEHLKKLEDGAVAVVGGQQAGILTGPLYSVYKAISVILLAKEQSEKLDQDVVPIFWIAGEDHDILEINHTYTIVNGLPKKKMYGANPARKTIASETRLDHGRMKELIDEIFKDYGETQYTRALHQSVLHHMYESSTFTDFFARLMNDLFKEEGLLLIDSAFPPFRQYQSRFFQCMIEKNEAICAAVIEKERLLEKNGYGKPVSETEENANLFFVKDGERFLLERKKGEFVNREANVKFSKEELLRLAEESPEHLSNNVVTRPLMQEMCLPVLAFVAGPGEMHYWAALKDAFDALNLQMPILAPRLNITLISRQVEQLLSEYHLDFEKVVHGGAEKIKRQFIQSIQDVEAKNKIDHMREMLEESYEKLRQYLHSKQLHLENIIEKNKRYHHMQFDYLLKKIEQEVLVKHESTIRRLNTLSSELYPNNNYQERIYNPYQYLNIYGPDLVRDLIKLPLKIGNSHFLVKL